MATKTALIEQHTAKSQTMLPLDELPKGSPAQLRVAQDSDTVAAYAGAYRDGHPMPPIVVFREEGEAGAPDRYWLADGHHRVAAARKAGLAEIDAIVKTGTQRDAILYACGANGRHGLPLTIADKERIVCTLLADPEWRAWSDREIGRHCCCSDKFVAKLRKREGADSATRKGKDGRTRPVPEKPVKDLGLPKGPPLTPMDLVRDDLFQNRAGCTAKHLARHVSAAGNLRVLTEELIRRGEIAFDESTRLYAFTPAGLAQHRLTLKELAKHACSVPADSMPAAPPAAPELPPAAGRMLIDAADAEPRAILGVGDTDFAAMADAQRFSDGAPIRDAQYLPATQALLRAVEDDSGDLPWILRPDGVADLAPSYVPPDRCSEPEPEADPAPPLQLAVPLAERRAAWIRRDLAGRIETAHTFAGSDREQAALLLLVGVSTDHAEHWREELVQAAPTLLADRLAAACASELAGHQHHRLPDIATLARLWGQDLASIRILADRSIPE